jgi:hypothetical protein
MPYINSDGQSIIQDWIHPHPIAIVDNTLVVNQGGNSSHYFSCGCEFIFEETIMRICGQYHEQRIAYTQASPRAVLEQIAKDFHALCNGGGGAVTPPVPVIRHDVEYVPNLATGFYDKVVHTWIDGVPQADVTTVTTYALGSPLPSTHDFEYYCDNTTGFLQQIEKITDSAGVVTTNITATTINCKVNTPIFAGFVCDNFGGTPAVAGTPATCNGGALVARNAGSTNQYTETPIGTFVPQNGAATLELYSNNPADPLQGFCEAQFTFDAGVDQDANSEQFIVSYVNGAGNIIALSTTFIQDIENQVGGQATQIFANTVASATAADGNVVTITYLGSNTTEAFSSNGALFFFENANGGASTINMKFSVPIRSLRIDSNNVFPNVGSISGLQAVQATTGTAPIPAQPASITQVKQFRNSDGTSFYENLNGTIHTVTGTIGRCQQNSQEILCDVNGIITTSFLRNYEVDTNGQIISFLDTDLQGVPYIPTGVVGSCDIAPPVEPTFEIVELCDTNIVVSGNLVTNGDFVTNSSNWILTGNVAHGSDNGPDALPGVLVFNSADAIPNGVASQAIGTTAGIPYLLTFRVGTVGILSNQQRLRAQVIDIDTNAILATAIFTPTMVASTTPDWNPTGSGTLNFVATGATTSLRFSDISTPPSVNKNLLLDKVVLTGSNPVSTKFLRKINSNGTIVNTTNGVTPYNPTGSVNVCDISPDETCIAPTKIGEVCVTDGVTTEKVAVMRSCATGAVSYLDIKTGVNVTAQIGTTLTIVPCITTTPCKKEIFATHDRVYVEAQVPTNIVGFDFDPTTYSCAGVDLSTVEFVEFQGCYGQSIPPSPIPAINAVAVNNYINSVIMPLYNACSGQAPLVSGDIIYQYNADLTGTVWYNATVVLYPFNFVVSQLGLNSVCQKIEPTIPTTHTFTEVIDYLCTSIQEIKEKDTCTGVESYRYVIESGGLLVDAVPFFVNFDEKNIKTSCPVKAIVPEVKKKLIGGVLKVTNNSLGDGTTEMPSGWDFSQLPEIVAGTHTLRSFAYKIFWEMTGSFLRVEFTATSSIYHYDNIFYQGSAKAFGEDTTLDLKIDDKVIFTTLGESFFEINYVLETI